VKVKTKVWIGKPFPGAVKGLTGLIAWSLLVLSVGFFVFTMYSEYFSGGLPYDLYIVYGGSMSPAMKAGSLAVVAPVDPMALAVGDIVTYRQAAGMSLPTTHRIVGISEKEGIRYLRTKGDGNEVEDQGSVNAERIDGRLVFFVPWIGYLLSFVNTGTGRLMLIFLPLAGMMIHEILKLSHQVSKYRALRSRKQ